jgi:hypothetical protein
MRVVGKRQESRSGKGEWIVGEEKRQYNKTQHVIGGGGVKLERTIRLELDVVQCV